MLRSQHANGCKSSALFCAFFLFCAQQKMLCNKLCQLQRTWISAARSLPKLTHNAAKMYAKHEKNPFKKIVTTNEMIHVAPPIHVEKTFPPACNATRQLCEQIETVLNEIKSSNNIENIEHHVTTMHAHVSQLLKEEANFAQVETFLYTLEGVLVVKYSNNLFIAAELIIPIYITLFTSYAIVDGYHYRGKFYKHLRRLLSLFETVMFADEEPKSNPPKRSGPSLFFFQTFTVAM